MHMNTVTTQRLPAVAGQFYPGDAGVLRDLLARYLAGAPAPTPDVDRLKALIVPHAGYIYSGATAGKGYGLLAAQAARIRRVVLLGPCHRVAVNGLAAPTVQAFATPLGSIPIDRAALDALADLPVQRGQRRIDRASDFLAGRENRRARILQNRSEVASIGAELGGRRVAFAY